MKNMFDSFLYRIKVHSPVIGKKGSRMIKECISTPIWDKPIPTITIYCNNQVVTFKVASENYNGKSRMLRQKHNHVRGLITNCIVVI